MLRVSKNGAVIAIGVTYSPASNKDVIEDFIGLFNRQSGETKLN